MNTIFLAQSDTTAGFLSKDKDYIAIIKKRPKNKKILIESSSIVLIKQNNRIPKIISKAIRRAKKTTFILPNHKAFRIIRDNLHLQFLKPFGMLYSSSANLSSKPFSYDFAYKAADVVVLDKRGIHLDKPSSIFKARHSIKKLR